MTKEVQDKSGRKYQIEISDDMKWCIPFLMKAKQLGIPIWRINKIKSHYVPLHKIEQSKAHIVKHYHNNKYDISILLYQQVQQKSGKYTFKTVGYRDLYVENFEDVLLSFAHELSHINFFNHDTNRFILETKLLYSFSKLSKKLGYKGYD